MTSKKIRWITQTALLLAVLVVLQSLTKGFGQLVTGSCVNAVLALSGLLVGLGSGITIALCSPVLAYLLGIAPQILTVPAIMAGNALYVFLLTQIAGGRTPPQAPKLPAWPLPPWANSPCCIFWSPRSSAASPPSRCWKPEP